MEKTLLNQLEGKEDVLKEFLEKEDLIRELLKSASLKTDNEVYEVRLGIERKGMYYSCNLLEYIVDIQEGSEVDLFLKEYTMPGKLLYFPKSIQTEIRNFEQKVRMSHRRASVNEKIYGVDRFFMTKTAYEKYLIEFRKYEEEHKELLNKLLNQYDDMIDLFVKSVGKIVKNKAKREKLIKEILANVPDKDRYADCFKMGINAMPVNLDRYPVAKKRFWGKSLQQSVDLALTCLNSYNKETEKKPKGIIANRTLGTIDDKIELIKDTNIDNNPEINELIEHFEKVSFYKQGTNALYRLEKIVNQSFMLTLKLGVSDMVPQLRKADDKLSKARGV